MNHPRTTTAAHLDALARCLSTSDDLSRPMTMFLDCMDRDQLGRGEQLASVDHTLVRVLAETVGQMVGQHVAVGERAMLTFWAKVEGQPFFHARLMLGRRVGAAFFFADRGLGCVSLTDGAETKFARLRVIGRGPIGDASRN
jgi:hypothetical protein